MALCYGSLRRHANCVLCSPLSRGLSTVTTGGPFPIRPPPHFSCPGLFGIEAILLLEALDEGDIPLLGVCGARAGLDFLLPGFVFRFPLRKRHSVRVQIERARERERTKESFVEREWGPWEGSGSGHWGCGRDIALWNEVEYDGGRARERTFRSNTPGTVALEKSSPLAILKRAYSYTRMR